MSQTKAQLINAVDGSIVDADIVGLTSSKLSGALPAISGASLTNLDAGKILQVVHTTKNDYFSTGSSSFTDVTGLSVAITPASSSNKIFIIACVQYSSAGSGGSRVQWRILQSHGGGTSAIATGGANGSNIEATAGSEATGGGGNMKSATINFLDSPSRTDAVTYKIQAIAPDGNDFRLNRPVNDSTASSYHQTASHITVMEVAA